MLELKFCVKTCLVGECTCLISLMKTAFSFKGVHLDGTLFCWY